MKRTKRKRTNAQGGNIYNDALAFVSLPSRYMKSPFFVFLFYKRLKVKLN